MRAVDVNVLVYAHRPESDRHNRYRTWLDGARRGVQPLGLIDTVLAGFIRIVTHPRVFAEPTPVPVALDFVDGLHRSPAAVRLDPLPRTWKLFAHLCRATDARGNRVPDAYLAATAMTHGATWCTADRGFARFPDLRVRHPLDDL